ncbi:MAG TPA: alanine dehydrogenase [Armatimonadota bacterium]|nr:alanine dehydrogenase [Armatimonadota bacterium]
MIVGVPTEIKDGEQRVAITPDGVATLTSDGHRVLVQAGAGAGAGIDDDQFASAGAVTVPSAEEVWGTSDLVLKVKEPVPQEYPLLRRGQVLFTYLHLAAGRELTLALLESGIVAIGYETVQLDNGTLPLLVPMSEVAGRLAVQAGARALEAHSGGRGILLGGVPGVAPADVAIIGAGVVGSNACTIAMGMRANVTVLDKSHDRLRYVQDTMHGNVITVIATPLSVARAVSYADLVIGAVLVPGASAPRLVTEAMVAAMKPGAAIVDVAIDQGGCVETMRPTSHSNPVFIHSGVVHYGVTNMPAAVPRTSTWALTNATMPYAQALAALSWERAAALDPALRRGIQIVDGQVVYDAVAQSLNLPLGSLPASVAS